ncbi:MAG: periplasmic heavy metal sensor [Pseudomonadota bacterium]
MTDQTTNTQGGGTPAWMKMALVASLVVNVAVIGLFIGASMKSDGKREGGANRQIAWIIELVPEERRDFTEAKFEAKRDDMRKARAARAKHMEEIVTAIRAEPFSPETLEYAMRMRRAAGEDRRTIVHSTLTEILVEFNPEERTEFANRLEDRLDRWMKRKQQP